MIFLRIDGKLILHPKLFSKLVHRLQYTLYSRKEYDLAKRIISNISVDTCSIDWAWAFYVFSNQSFCSKLTSWGYNKHAVNRKRLGGCASQFKRGISELRRYIDRLQYVQIECDDAIKIIKRFDMPDTVLYCDPPYLMESRVAKVVLYKHEMTREQHIKLLDCLLSCQGAVVLSGYPSELYSEKLKDWSIDKRDCETLLSGIKSNARQEVIWRNARAIELSGDLRFF